MNAKVYDITGKETGSVELNAEVFGLEVNEGLIHRALVLQQANARTNVAHTKTRGERRGSTRKLFRQKGTGRARMGGNRSPIRKGGGVVFGPRNNRNFTLEMNKKERRKAIMCMLSSKVANNAFIVVDGFDKAEAKTKTMNTTMQALPLNGKALVALGKDHENAKRSASNLSYVKVISQDFLNIVDLLKYETLVVSKEGVEALNALKVK